MKNKRKKLLLLSVTLGRGGAENHLVRIANQLSDCFEVHIGVVRAGGSYEAKVFPDVVIHHLGSVLVDFSTLLGCHQAAGKLAILIDKLHPDCVISFLPPVAYTCFRAQKRCSHKFAYVAAIQNNLDRSLQTLEGWLRRPIRNGVLSAIADASGVIAISDGVAENLLERLPGLKSRTRTIYNAAIESGTPSDGGRSERSDGTPKPGVSDVFRIVACGRLTEQKGFCDLLDALHLVLEKTDANLKILGNGPLLESLTAQAKKLRIENKVEFVGFQPDPLMHFEDADLFVLSSWWEGFGNVIVESMSVGTPVVSTDCPFGPAEIIDNRVNGILVPPRDPRQLSNAILSMIENPSLRRTLSLNGQKRAQAFRAGAIAEQYAAFINEIIESE